MAEGMLNVGPKLTLVGLRDSEKGGKGQRQEERKGRGLEEELYIQTKHFSVPMME